MNRERLKALRDHLAGLPDERVDMDYVRIERDCGSVCCIAGWANELWAEGDIHTTTAQNLLGLSDEQASALFYAEVPDGDGDFGVLTLAKLSELTRLDAIAAIDSMLANPGDDALPFWPEK